jgi:hypothetical protein
VLYKDEYVYRNLRDYPENHWRNRVRVGAMLAACILYFMLDMEGEGDCYEDPHIERQNHFF